MPFPRLIVRQAPPAQAGLTARADVALFVGLTPRRTATPVPEALRAWLTDAGWAGPGAFARSPQAVEALLDVPVPVECWSDFDALFAWDERPTEAGSPARVPCPLGLAVRSFFAEGGARAYVVRVGDPRPLLDRDLTDAQVVTAKRKLLSWPEGQATPPDALPPDVALRVPLLPGLGDIGLSADAFDPGTWRGAAHVWGLDDVALLSLPDLPDLVSGAPIPTPNPPAPPPTPEQFKTCAPAAAVFEVDPRRNRLDVSAPRLDRDGYRAWAQALRHMLDMLALPRGPGHRRDVMLVASLPLPSPATDAVPPRTEAWPLALLDDLGLLASHRLGSARLQLAYPWVETAASTILPEGVEAPEGVFLGAIARTALSDGAFRSTAGRDLPSVTRLLPELGSGDLMRGLPGGAADWLGDRLSLIGLKTGRPVILSDATAAADRMWRAGGVSRLMNVILRAAKTLGTSRIFESAGPPLWAALKRELEGYMGRLWDAGALAGATRDEAFTVRCDATTMSQADIDAGRTVCTLAFQAAQPIQQITVTLALSEDAAAAREAA